MSMRRNNMPEDVAQELVRRFSQTDPTDYGQAYMLAWPGGIGGAPLRALIPSANLVHFDFIRRQVTLPDDVPASLNLPTTMHVPRGVPLRSIFIWADDTCAIRLLPGDGEIYFDAHSWYSCPGDIEEMTLRTLGPTIFWVVFSTRPAPMFVQPAATHSERWGNPTLTKVESAATPDDWSDIPMALSDDLIQLDPATTGVNLIHVNAIGQKTFIVENTGAVDANVNVQIRHVAGKAWADVPQVPASVDVPAGETVLIETMIHSHHIRIRGRVDAAVAAAGETTLEVQFRGLDMI